MSARWLAVTRLCWTSLGGAVLLLAAMASAAAPGDNHWDTKFGWPGPGNNNFAVAAHNGKLYAAGLVSSTNSPLMMWDGAQWNAFSQFYGFPTEILDLAFVGDTLYAAGLFTNVNGVTANGVAKWDGTSWSSIGFKGTAYCLASDGVSLYVGGIFSTNLNGLVLNNIGRWDGANWSALGNGLGYSSNASAVYSILVTNGTIYGAGVFTNSGPAAVTNAASWNGASWQPLAGGPGATVTSLAMTGGYLYAAGTFGASGVSQWNGSSWALTGSGFNAGAQSLTVFNSQLYAVGSFTTASGSPAAGAAMWNGSTWAPLGSGLSATGNKVVSTGANILAGGNFLLAGGLVANGFATWDGTNWSVIGTPGRLNGASSSVHTIAYDGTNYYLGGFFTAISSTMANDIVRFDGTNYYPLGSGMGPTASSTIVSSISVTNGHVYAGGYFSTAGGVSAVNAAMWDGTNWYALGGSPGGEVFTIAARPEGVYASGTYYDGSSYGGGFLTLWNGASWNNVLTYNGTNTLEQFPLSTTVGMFTFAFQGTDLYVSGAFNLIWHNSDFSVETNCSDILVFDGASANIMGTGLSTNASAMAIFKNALYCGGFFTTAGGVAAKGLATWDGANWHPVGGGVVGNGGVDSLTTDGTYLYVGGTFTNLGGAPYSRIAKWDGANWSAFGSGTSSTVSGMAVSGPDLYAGGSFRLAGGKPSYNFGHWNSQSNFDLPILTNSVWLTNGEFQTRLYGTGGLTNSIQVSTDLKTWSGVSTNTNGVYDFADPNSAGAKARFYRGAVLQ